MSDGLTILAVGALGLFLGLRMGAKSSRKVATAQTKNDDAPGGDDAFGIVAAPTTSGKSGAGKCGC